jgi:predicted nucleic acid-binding protein
MDQLTRAGLVYISTVTRAEIFTGMRPQQEQSTLALLHALTSIAADDAIADQAGRWMYQYARQGIQLSLPDALIAATALLHNLTLVTTNFKHFPMPQLKLRPI